MNNVFIASYVVRLGASVVFFLFSFRFFYFFLLFFLFLIFVYVVDLIIFFPYTKKKHEIFGKENNQSTMIAPELDYNRTIRD